MKIESEKFFVDKFLNHLYDCRDTDNLILKGHILTEYYLQHSINQLAVEKLNFDKVRFTFSNKIEIAKLVGVFTREIDLYAELRLLNKLRNSIAHNLGYDKSILNDFLSRFEQHKSVYGNEKANNLQIGREIFINIKGEQITFDGSHMMLMLYMSSICTRLYFSNKLTKK
jgi:hypothetical protein